MMIQAFLRRRRIFAKHDVSLQSRPAFCMVCPSTSLSSIGTIFNRDGRVFIPLTQTKKIQGVERQHHPCITRFAVELEPRSYHGSICLDLFLNAILSLTRLFFGIRKHYLDGIEFRSSHQKICSKSSCMCVLDHGCLK